MSIAPIKDIVIVGGGTAGWMAAAALSKVLNSSYRIQLVESDEIATIGVGEATIPGIKLFNAALGIDENEFLRQTNGTFKLGIEFVDWGSIGTSYTHGFGKIGRDSGFASFHHYWLKAYQAGLAPELGEYSINSVAPKYSKYMRGVAEMSESPLGDIENAFHFDAGLYAKFLRNFAELHGVKRKEGKIVRVTQRDHDGFIQSVILESGAEICGDFFLDCSGIRGVLIEQTLKAGYDDWTHWLPCDRAIAVPCASVEPLLPITRSTAHSAGWQWRIPLQNRIGNGHVYSSKFMTQEQATSILMGNLDGAPLAEPRYIPYVPGRRKRAWDHNCVALGLAAGFFEPIESTNIHLIQTAINRIITLFPNSGFQQADTDEYNRQTAFEYERIRDFIILHYKATTRNDSPFWNYCRTMDIPDTLQHKIDLYRSNGRFFREGGELFAESSWIQVMHGQGIRAQSYNPLVDLRSQEEVRDLLTNTATVIQKCVAVMPTHAEYVAKHCAATR